MKKMLLNHYRRISDYGNSYGGIHEFGLTDAADENDFLAKVETLKPKWEKLCPGFHNWFLTKNNIFL